MLLHSSHPSCSYNLPILSLECFLYAATTHASSMLLCFLYAAKMYPSFHWNSSSTLLNSAHPSTGFQPLPILPMQTLQSFFWYTLPILPPVSREEMPRRAESECRRQEKGTDAKGKERGVESCQERRERVETRQKMKSTRGQSQSGAKTRERKVCEDV